MSESTEMYLLTIYRLNLQYHKASNSLMAKWMNVSTASITGMVKKLQKQGLVERKDRNLYLTDSGRAIAMNVIRKHRLAECLISKDLGLPWDIAHAQSCRLEHILDDRVVDAIEKHLGHPTHCPHGHPIPDKEGNLTLKEVPRVAEFEEGDTVIVERVSEESAEILQLLEELNCYPGTQIKIKKVNPRDRTMLIQIGDELYPMSQNTARKIWASKV